MGKNKFMLGIIIAIIGVSSLTYGALITLGVIKTDVAKDSEFDKKMISGKDRYRLGRYNAGFQFIIVGIGGLILGIGLFLS